MKKSAYDASRMYIHRRIVVRFLEALLVLLSVAAFVTIALGLGTATPSAGQEDSGTPTKLTDTTPFYVLLIGSDSLEGTALYTGDVNARQQGDPQADSLLLTRVDPGECTLTFVTIPSNTVIEDADELVRDTLTETSAKDTVHMVERIAGVSVRYHFVMGFSAFETLVSQIGNVTTDVPVAITMEDPVTAKAVTVPAGKDIELDAAQTLAFLRSSEPYVADADPHRQLNVRTVIGNLVMQVLESEDSVVRKDLGVFEGQVQTNMGNNTLISLVTRFYDEKERVQIYACTGPYLSSSINANGEPVIESQVSAWRELMTVVDSGADPAEVMPQYNFQGSEDDYVKPKAPASSTSASASSSSSSSKGSKPAKEKSSSTSSSSKAS